MQKNAVVRPEHAQQSSTQTLHGHPSSRNFPFSSLITACLCSNMCYALRQRVGAVTWPRHMWNGDGDLLRFGWATGQPRVKALAPHERFATPKRNIARALSGTRGRGALVVVALCTGRRRWLGEGAS
ncbi:unnamed protein product [Lampetra planeri]